MARVILGVGAGIAAYKACELLRLLKESGHAVRVIPTPDALRFVGAATWEALSGEPVTTDVWTGVADVPHVKLGQGADLVIVAPATADLLARAATGMSNDLLTATLLTARCPVVYVPAMHTEMWEHPATQHNVATLRARSAVVVEPAVGRLTGKDSGKGRLPDPEALFDLAERIISSRTGPGSALAPPASLPGGGAGRAAGCVPPEEATGDQDGNRAAVRDAPGFSLAGRKLLISAGGTREELDPVRFLGNWSTGRQGYAFARSAVAQGAEVILVAANVELPDPAGAKVVKVISARDMHAAMLAEAPSADAIIMTAAVADFRPVARAGHKIKKDGTVPPPVELTENPDILADLAKRRKEQGPGGQVIVGFAAETDPGLDAALLKLARKGCDLLVMNQVGGGQGFGATDNEWLVLDADGTVTPIPHQSKDALADDVLALVTARLA
ncbi:MAG TPA: bifunctional phosphopantothenoylcysteine decarboxylase/phosphopantothenate synthase [Trebonia sp.]|nr:bifunctional phosphopantothenoylcysteine decarboxylase/phosphopantothenate synthase [Trebonia sp.]